VSNHDLVESIQSRVTKAEQSFQVTSLQTRVNDESNINKHFRYAGVF